MGFTTQAMAAKAKAMYGHHLTKENYTELLRKKSVNEIAAYLKNETAYQSILQGINDASIHRGYLEMLIRQSFFVDFIELIRYGEPKNHQFYQYGILMIEIKQILVSIRQLNDPERENHVAQLPLFANKMTSFNLEKLVSVNSFDDILEVLKDTVYEPLLKPLKPSKLDDLDFAQCELVLKNYYYRRVNELIEKEFKGKIKKQIKALFDTRIELDNIVKIYRLKKYYKSSPDDIKKVINPTFVKIPKNTLYDWIEHKNAEEFLSALSESAYKSAINNQDFVYIEYHMDGIINNLSKHLIRFSNEPNMVLVAYLSVLEIEIQNIVDIIEGVRYHVESEKIARLLIY